MHDSPDARNGTLSPAAGTFPSPSLAESMAASSRLRLRRAARGLAACWTRAYAEIAAAHDASLSDIDLAALTGASVARAADQLASDLGSAIRHQELRRALSEQFIRSPPPALFGARALVVALAARIPVAVASNAPLVIVEGILEHHRLREHFDSVVSAEQTAADKPAPDVYVEACRRLGVCPSDAVAFEDSPMGASAARAAGLVLVAVPSAPGIRIDADLTVGALDEPRLLEYLALDLTRRIRR